MKNKFILASLLFTVLTFAQTPSIKWQKSLGGTSDDICNASVLSPDGSIVMAGYTYSNDGDITKNMGGNDFWVVKIDADGQKVWDKSFGGSLYEEAQSIINTKDGGYIVSGYTTSSDGDVSEIKYPGSRNFWIVKLDANGSKEWEKVYGGSISETAFSIQELVEGGYIIAGMGSSQNGDVTDNHNSDDFWILKITITGDIVWNKSLGGTDTDEAYSVQQTVDGGFIVAGYTNSNDGDVSSSLGSIDAWVVKLSNSGTIEWEHRYGGSSTDKAYSIIQTLEGGYIFAGSTYSTDGDITNPLGNSDFWVVKISAIGDIEWKRNYGGGGLEAAKSIKLTADGGYVVAGESNSSDGDLFFNNGFEDYLVFKLSNTGDIQWHKVLGGSKFDKGSDIHQTLDGNYVVTGTVGSTDGEVFENKGVVDYWAVKLDVFNMENATFELDLVSVNPNPSKGVFLINFDKSNVALKTVEVYNAIGQCVLIKNQGEITNSEIDMSNQNSGIYLMKITDDNNNNYLKKVILE